MNDAKRYYIPKEPGRWRAITLAAVMHLALVAFLWIGIRWHSETPVAVEAEIWSPQAQQAAPKPEPQPEPEPAPKVQEAPKPQPAPPPVEREAARPVEKPVVPDPEIAIEQQRKKRLKEERERRLAEEREEEKRQEEKERLAAQKKQEQQRAEEKRRKEELAKAEEAKERKLEEEQKRKQAELARQKQEAEEKKRELAEAEKKKKLAEAAEKKKRDAAETARAEAVHKEEMSRMLSQAAGSGGSGEAAHSSGPSRGDAGYVAKVAGKIRSNTVFNVPDDLAGNPAAEYAVDLLPDGSVRSIRKVKSSGVPGFDEAVRRAIEKSQPFPKDKTGQVPSGFTVSHKPKDQ